MKKLNERERRKQLEALAGMPDQSIDTSDIPELTEEEIQRGVKGLMYRPVKWSVTIRLDADVVEWLKSAGPGYQTRANTILRAAMVRTRAHGPANAGSAEEFSKSGRHRIRKPRRA